MQKPIVQLGHDALRTMCTPVPVEQMQSDAVVSLIQDLRDTLAQEKDGVGLSAPQIAVTKRVALIGRLAFTVDGDPDADHQDLILINPRIVSASKKKEEMEEGCLSIRWIYGTVARHKQITVEYYDETGAKQSRGFSGFLSHVVQHELDHLNGVLFIDHARDLYELSAEEIARLNQDHHAA